MTKFCSIQFLCLRTFLFLCENRQHNDFDEEMTISATRSTFAGGLTCARAGTQVTRLSFEILDAPLSFRIKTI